MHSLKEEFHYLFEKSKDLGEGILKPINWIEKTSHTIEIVCQRLNGGLGK